MKIVPVVLVLALFSSSGLHSEVKQGDNETSLSINLQEFPLYLKKGFDPKDAAAPVLDDTNWLVRKPFSNVIAGRQGLPGLQKRAFLSPLSRDAEEFTFVIPFTAAGISARDSVPGLFLAGIGDNWEVYLNGVLVRSEMHFVRPDGTKTAVFSPGVKITEHHSEREVFFPFSAGLLREGENLLVFRIVGESADATVGFQYSSPFYISAYDTIRKKNSEMIEMILIGGYILVALYHFLIFASRPKDRYNAYCGLFSGLFGLYHLFRTHTIYFFIPDTLAVVKLEFFCVFLVLPALGAFTESLCWGKVSPLTKVYAGICAFLALSQLALPHPYGSDALVVWQILGIAAFLWILVNGVIRAFVRDIREAKKQQSLRGIKAPGILPLLWETYSGNLVIGVGVVVVSAIIDIFNSLFLHYSFGVTRYSFFAFVLAVTLMLAKIYSRLNNELQARNIFLANVSHEIRTPMGSILGMAELILRENPAPGIREKAGQIRLAGNTLLSIINDLLDFTKIESGKMELVHQEYRFASLTGDVVDIIKIRLGNRDIEFVTEIDPAIPPALVGDELRIRQILLNLLGNAVKFTNRGKIIFRAALGENDPVRPVIVFTVEDTGIGIKPEDMGSLFSEFSRINSRRNRLIEGAGLGLAICKNLCGLMGGEIRVESEFGKGSAFTVTLPQRTGSGIIPEEKKTASLLEQGIIMPGARALIVEDLPSNRQVIAGLLEPYRLQIHSAGSGMEALELVRSYSYDLIFMDHMMEGMDGVETAAAIRKIEGFAETPIVALTADAVAGMREFFLERGFQDYISKPIIITELDAVIGRRIPAEMQLSGERRRTNDRRSVSDRRGRRERRNRRDRRMVAAVNGVSVDFLRNKNSTPAGAELTLYRLERLKHYLWHFENGLEADGAYLAKFGDLSAALGNTELAEAGRRGDIEKIREALPGFYQELRQGIEESEEELASAESAGLDASLSGLKKALAAGDAAGADRVMRELGQFPLGKDAREAYFLLYDLLMMGETEKAAGALTLWEKIRGGNVSPLPPAGHGADGAGA